MILREIIKSKIHKAAITKTEIDYAGSIGIDETLLKEADIIPGEKVQVLNFNNGKRFETYVIAEKKDSGKIILYGPASRCGKISDRICIISYLSATPDEIGKIKAKVVLVDTNNKILR